MNITLGPPVTDSDFYPRQQICEKLTRVLPRADVLFLAPRRTGKTSVLLQIKKTAPLNVVYIDLEAISSPSAWIAELAAKTSGFLGTTQRLVDQAETFLQRVKLQSGSIAAKPWQQQGENLLAKLEKQDKPLWFFLDEFPIMIDQIAKTHHANEAAAAVHWLRHVRQQNPNSKIRFLLTGSIGLDNVLRRHGIRGAANDLHRETLQPLTEQEALEFCLNLASHNQIPLSETHARTYIQRLGPARWPFLLQLFVAECEDALHQNGAIGNIDDIFQAIAKNKSHRNNYCENMWERLKDIFSETEASTARNLLRLLAATDNRLDFEQLRGQPSPLTPDDFVNVLEVLQHDGYLYETDAKRLGFFSHLLREFWRYKERLL